MFGSGLGEGAEGAGGGSAPEPGCRGSRCRAGARLPLRPDPRLKILGRDAQPGAELDRDELTVAYRAANGLLGELARAGDLFDREQPRAGNGDRDRDVPRLQELRRIMELEADRQLTIGPPGATPGMRGPGPRAPTVNAPARSSAQQQPPRSSRTLSP